MAKRPRKPLDEPGLTDPDSGSTGSPTPAESMNKPELGSAPKPAEAEAAVAVAASEETAKPEPERVLPSVPLRVFAGVSGVKPDLFRPFSVYATREEMRPCPIPEWKERYKAFLSKPIKRAR